MSDKNADRRRKPIDWEAVERDYRAGGLSISEIARQHDISHTAVNKKAKQHGWQRNLIERVREAAAAKLVSDAVSETADLVSDRAESVSDSSESAPAKVSSFNEEETVAAAAMRVVALVRSHRSSLARMNARMKQLGDRFDELLPAIGDLVSLERAAGIQESMARTYARLIPLERQAFNVDASPEGEDGRPMVSIYMPENGR